MRNWNSLIDSKDLNKLIQWTGDWRREKGFQTGWINFPEKLMLITTELNEVAEGMEANDIENVVEEWIDVCVRTIDLIEACSLSIRESIRERITEGDEYIKEYFDSCCDEGEKSLEQIINASCWACTRDLAYAMEEFRDIELIEGFPKDGIATSVKLDSISSSLSSVLFEAFSIVSYLDIDWWDAYVSKMIKNEGRPARHGRQR